MNDTLLREHIRAVHVEIHKLRQQPGHPVQFELMKLYETSLADLYFARQELKRIDIRRASCIHERKEEQR